MSFPTHPPLGGPAADQLPHLQGQPPIPPQQWPPTGRYTTGHPPHGATYPMYGAPPHHMIPRPLSATGRAVATIYALGAVMLLHLLTIPITLWENNIVRRYGMDAFTGTEAPGEVAAWGLTLFGIALFLVAATITSAVLFLMWIHRAYRVLEENGVPGLKHTPGWAVGWWFIPIANLAKPYEVVKEVFERSERNQPSASMSFTAQKESSWIVGAWWLVWITACLATNVSSFMTSFNHSAEQYILSNWLGIAATVLFILAGGLAIMVVRDIDNRQRRAFGSNAPIRPTATTPSELWR